VQFVNVILRYILEHKFKTVRQGSECLDPVRPALSRGLDYMSSRGLFQHMLLCDSVLFLCGSTGQVLVVYSEFPLSFSKYMFMCVSTSKCVLLFHGYEQSLCNNETKLHMQTPEL